MWERIYVHGPLAFITKITVQRNRDGSEATRFNDEIGPISTIKNL